MNVRKLNDMKELGSLAWIIELEQMLEKGNVNEAWRTFQQNISSLIHSNRLLRVVEARIRQHETATVAVA